MIFVFLTCAGVGCQTAPATSCAGFSLNDLSAAGTVALIKVDRKGANNVIGNDRNFVRRKCGAKP